jgi:hypothetical protein
MNGAGAAARTHPTQLPPTTSTITTHDTSILFSVATVEGSCSHSLATDLRVQLGHNRICAVCMAVDVAATASIATAGPITAGPVSVPGHSASQSAATDVSVHGQATDDATPCSAYLLINITVSQQRS